MGRRKELVNGFLNLYKPAGMTSHDCVDKVRKIVGTRRVGHGGTLDPMATGVLPIAIGNCTKLLRFIDNKKVYSGGMQFGITTDSDDAEGKVLKKVDASWVTKEMVLQALAPMIGDNIRQRPPLVSAIKLDGIRLHERVRKGMMDDPATAVKVPMRRVSIQNIELTAWNRLEDFTVVAQVTVECSSGTYIRSIARDAGEAITDKTRNVSVGASLANLERLQSGPFLIKDCTTFDDLSRSVESFLLKPDIPLRNLPRIELQPSDGRKFRHGSFQQVEDIKFPSSMKNYDELFVRVYDANEFCGVGLVCDDRILKPSVVLK